MEEFVYIIKPKRNDFMETMTDIEAQVMEQHFVYLKNMLSEDKLIMAGPCLDGAFGIVVFKADNIRAARHIMENDPAVTGKLMDADLHPYRVSLFQKG